MLRCASVSQNSPHTRRLFCCSIGIPPDLSAHNDGILPLSFSPSRQITLIHLLLGGLAAVELFLITD